MKNIHQNYVFNRIYRGTIGTQEISRRFLLLHMLLRQLFPSFRNVCVILDQKSYKKKQIMILECDQEWKERGSNKLAFCF